MSQDEIKEEKYSSIENELTLLARELPRGRAERFLLDLANLRETDPASVSRFQKNYSDFLPLAPGQGRIALESTTQSGLSAVQFFPQLIFELQFLLRQAWRCPTRLDREVHLDLTRHKVYEQFLRVTTMKPADDSPLRKVWKTLGYILIGLNLAQRVADRMRRCENSSCPAPYFIAKRRNQKFCSEVCAGPSQREQKSAWWREHGEQWRIDHPQKKSKKAKR